jgi:hypothetical protein
VIINSFVEIDNKNTAIYDGLHEYCMVEHMNEEYLRTSINKRRRSVLIRILQGILCVGIKR